MASNNQGGNKQSGGTSNRGFASMDPERQREIASEGGRAAHAKGTAHEFTSEEARRAGSMSHGGGNQQSGNRSDSQQSGNRSGNQQSGNRSDSQQSGNRSDSQQSGGRSGSQQSGNQGGNQQSGNRGNKSGSSSGNR
jgi:hypothetical protein